MGECDCMCMHCEVGYHCGKGKCHWFAPDVPIDRQSESRSGEPECVPSTDGSDEDELSAA